MRKSEYLPTHIQDRISYEERVQRARDMAKEEKEMAVLAEMEEFYAGKSTDQSLMKSGYNVQGIWQKKKKKWQYLQKWKSFTQVNLQIRA